MNTVLITGANRGLGLEFCKQYAAQGWRVIATCRQPEQADELNRLAGETEALEICKMDVMDKAEVDAIAAQLKGKSIDILIANAGVYGDNKGQNLGAINYDAWKLTLETNVLGVVRVIEACLPMLKLSAKAKIAVLSSQMGSIEDNGSGGSILYRSSKAALNATMKSIAIDLQDEEIGVLIFHPGWVKTDMGGPHALIDTTTSVIGMIKQISDFNMSQTGRFIKYDGLLLPW